MVDKQKRGVNGSSATRTITDAGLRGNRNGRQFDAAIVYDKLFSAYDIARHPFQHLRNLSPRTKGLIIAAGLAFPGGMIFQSQTNVIPKFEGPSAGVSLQKETFHANGDDADIHATRIGWTQDAFAALLTDEGKAYISDALKDSNKQENVGKAFNSYFAAVQKINSGELAKDTVLQLQLATDIEAFDQYLGQPGAHKNASPKDLVQAVSAVSDEIKAELESKFGTDFPEIDYPTYVATVNALHQQGTSLPGPGG